MVLRRADDAMYCANCGGKDGIAHVGAVPATEAHPFTDLRRALDTGQVMGFETCLRWQHPTRGVLPGSEFLATTSRPGTQPDDVLHDMALFVLTESVRMAATWSQHFRPQAPAVHVG